MSEVSDFSSPDGRYERSLDVELPEDTAQNSEEAFFMFNFIDFKVVSLSVHAPCQIILNECPKFTHNL